MHSEKQRESESPRRENDGSARARARRRRRRVGAARQAVEEAAEQSTESRVVVSCPGATLLCSCCRSSYQMPRRRGSSSSSSAAGGSGGGGGGGGGFGLASLRRELHLHNFFRTSSPSSASTSRTPALPPRSSASITIPGGNHKLTSSASSYHPPRELTVSTFSAGSATAADGLGGAHLTPSLSSSVHARRESFLYRASDDLREASSLRPVSRASSIASNEHG
ncbi:hypothetical protein B9Z55_005388 [Caenorhabditis nigoni]|uniref:Uncharacterized protein n=1 Tax=Caenorhabditis nigoni TaxID=1611254 RepID=A0A2G5V116_9PELO|nr:hypothetical protein B9Z55_005388 [Caenorhabditis nigoni]